MMCLFDGSFEHLAAFFPNQTSQEIHQRWSLIKYQDSHSSAEVQRTITTERPKPKPKPKPHEEMDREKELETFLCEEVPIFDIGDNWWQFYDWNK
jgi:hypothetical protein